MIYMVKRHVFILLMPVEDCINILVITLTRVFIKPTPREDCINALVPTFIDFYGHKTCVYLTHFCEGLYKYICSDINIYGQIHVFM